MRESVPTARYSPVCNVLRQWKTSLILTYRIYRLYDSDACFIFADTALRHKNCLHSDNRAIFKDFADDRHAELSPKIGFCLLLFACAKRAALKHSIRAIDALK